MDLYLLSVFYISFFKTPCRFFMKQFKGHLIFSGLLFSKIAISTVIFTMIIGISPLNAEPLNFEQIKQKVMNNHPEIFVQEASIKAAEAGIQQAKTIPNPELEIGLENWGDNEIETVLTQPLEIGGKRKTRVVLAQKDLQAAQLEKEAILLSLQAEIIRRCTPILGLQKKIDIIDSLYSVIHESLRDIKRRIRAGAAREADALRTEMELDELLIQKTALNRELQTQKKAIAALWGETSDTETDLEGTIITPIILPPVSDILKQMSEHPEFELMKLSQETAIAEANQLKAEAFPEVSISGGYLQNNEENENAVLAGVSISLPVFNRNKGAIASKNHEVQAERKKYRAFMIERSTEVKAILSEIENIDEEFSAVTHTLQPKIKNVHRILESHYQKGKISILEVLESRRHLLEIKLRRVDLTTRKVLLVADLTELTGIDVPVIR